MLKFVAISYEVHIIESNILPTWKCVLLYQKQDNLFLLPSLQKQGCNHRGDLQNRGPSQSRGGGADFTDQIGFVSPNKIMWLHP